MIPSVKRRRSAPNQYQLYMVIWMIKHQKYISYAKGVEVMSMAFTESLVTFCMVAWFGSFTLWIYNGPGTLVKVVCKILVGGQDQFNDFFNRPVLRKALGFDLLFRVLRGKTRRTRCLYPCGWTLNKYLTTGNNDRGCLCSILHGSILINNSIPLLLDLYWIIDRCYE